MKLKITAKIPILLIVVFLLIFAANNYINTSADTFAKYIIAISVSLAIYLVPGAVYIFTKPKGFISAMSPEKPKLSHIPIITAATLTVIFSASLYSVISYSLGSTAIDSNSSFTANPIIAVILLAILPAFLEELLFRGIVLTEYSNYGIFTAALFSSVCFAMFHFSLPGFIYYFVSGMILAYTAVATGSLLASFAVHLFSNLFFMYGNKYVENLIYNFSETTFIVTVFLLLTLISLFWFLSALDRYYLKLAYSKAADDDKKEISSKKKYSIPRALAEAFLSPSFLVLAVMFIAMALDIL